jgi:hypothetical protein
MNSNYILQLAELIARAKQGMQPKAGATSNKRTFMGGGGAGTSAVQNKTMTGGNVDTGGFLDIYDLIAGNPVGATRRGFWDAVGGIFGSSNPINAAASSPMTGAAYDWTSIFGG